MEQSPLLSQLFKTSPALYGSWKFIILSTKAYPAGDEFSHTLCVFSIYINTDPPLLCLCLSKVSSFHIFRLSFCMKGPFLMSHACCLACPFHPWFDQQYSLMNGTNCIVLAVWFYTSSCYFVVRFVYAPQHLLRRYPQSLYFVFVCETCFHTHIKQQVKRNVLLHKNHILCVCFY
jgi:hypothetical protein